MEAEIQKLVDVLKTCDYILLDRRSPRDHWDAVHEAERRGLVYSEFKEIDEQETQLRIRLKRPDPASRAESR